MPRSTDERRCNQCQVITIAAVHGMCPRCVAEYKADGCWCDEHGATFNGVCRCEVRHVVA